MDKSKSGTKKFGSWSLRILHPIILESDLLLPLLIPALYFALHPSFFTRFTEALIDIKAIVGWGLLALLIIIIWVLSLRAIIKTHELSETARHMLIALHYIILMIMSIPVIDVQWKLLFALDGSIFFVLNALYILFFSALIWLRVGSLVWFYEFHKNELYSRISNKQMSSRQIIALLLVIVAVYFLLDRYYDGMSHVLLTLAYSRLAVSLLRLNYA